MGVHLHLNRRNVAGLTLFKLAAASRPHGRLVFVPFVKLRVNLPVFNARIRVWEISCVRDGDRGTRLKGS